MTERIYEEAPIGVVSRLEYKTSEYARIESRKSPVSKLYQDSNTRGYDI